MTADATLCLDIFKEIMGLCGTVGILLIIGICNLTCSTECFRRQLVRFPIFLSIRDGCEFASCNWTGCGKVLRTLWSVFSIASFCLFIGHTIEHPKQIIFEKTNVDNIMVYIDLGLNAYFIIFFVIRFIGSNDKWSFIVSSSTWMEVLTIGPSITAVMGTRKQLMFSFLRALRLSGLKDLVFVIGIVKRSQLKTLTNILTNVICFWCVFAGIVYQTENLTAFWKVDGWKICATSKEALTGNIDFFRSMYFLLVTASSVGYGDITPSNYATKAAIIIFVAIAVTFFASIIPEIYAVCSVPQNFGNRSFYTGAGEKHVLYCGSSQLNMLKSFFWNFYHTDAKLSSEMLRVCFLQSQSRQLSEQITWFLRSFCGRITVVFGSPSDSECLMRSCKLRRTEAVILTSEAGMRSDFEADRLNYVRTIGLKLCAPHCRTIVQIKSMFHKQSFRALPLWRTRQEKPGALPPDAVLCDNQVLLGLMGVNSVAPGFATLLINLLSYRESQVVSAGATSAGWRGAYSDGILAKFYCVSFSARHRDRSFKAVALDAYQACGVLLIGVRMIDKLTGILTGVINPSFDPSFTINPSTMKAFLISRDFHAAQAFASCTSGVPRAGLTSVCVHDMSSGQMANGDRSGMQASKDASGEHGDTGVSKSAEANGPSAIGVSYDLSDDVDFVTSASDDDQQSAERAPPPPPLAPTASSLGHQEERKLEDWFQTNIDAMCPDPIHLHDAEHRVPPLEDITGTLHWAPNRRCRTFSVAEAKTIEFSNHIVIVVIGSLEHPLGLSSFVLPLRNYSIPTAHLSDIVILGDAQSIEKHEWRGIKNFPFIYVVDGSGVCPQHLLYCRAHKAAAMVVFNLKERGTGPDPFLADKMTLQCTENLRGLGAKDCHVTSELFYSPNAYCFSDPAERLADISASDVMDTQSFAEGLVVSSPNLTGLLASVYFCPESLAFLESVIYGSNQPSVDDYLSLDFCIPSALSRDGSSDSAGDRSRVFNFRVLQLGAGEAPLCDLFQLFDCKEMKWEDLLIGCLDKFDIMCLGIYRRRTVKKKKENAPETTSGWFVLTFPEPGLQIDQKDRIFCFAPPPKRPHS